MKLRERYLTQCRSKNLPKTVSNYNNTRLPQTNKQQLKNKKTQKHKIAVEKTRAAVMNSSIILTTNPSSRVYAADPWLGGMLQLQTPTNSPEVGRKKQGVIGPATPSPHRAPRQLSSQQLQEEGGGAEVTLHRDMGCTPSIHVSQTGVVYCQDSEVRSGSSSTNSHAPAVMVATKGAGLTLGQQVFADPVRLGPMTVSAGPMSILIVFPQEDAQCTAYRKAAERGNYVCDVVGKPESTMQTYMERKHDVVLLDCRLPSVFNAEALCWSIRATKTSDHSTFIAVTKASSNKDEPSVIPLLKAGFNRRVTENTNVGACLDELLMIEMECVRLRRQVQAAKALFTALDKVSDAVEIMDYKQKTQYTNRAVETLVGYSADELAGRSAREVLRSDKNKPDVYEAISQHMSRAKDWEGTMYVRRKNGETVQVMSGIYGVAGPPVNGRETSHYVCVRSAARDGSSLQERHARDSTEAHVLPLRGTGLKRGSIISLTSIGSEAIGGRRKDSVARIHHMTIEAPITRVINIITAAHEKAPMPVMQDLKQVLDILKQSDLYVPNIQSQLNREDDPTHVVEGLLANGNTIRRRPSGPITDNPRGLPRTAPSPSLSELPEDIRVLLDSALDWDFNIIKLEKLSSGRPLVYLGLKLLDHFRATEVLRCPETVLKNWLMVIEANYRSSNTYHNSTHAADVMQAASYFMAKSRLKGSLDAVTEVMCLVAAAIHDVDHPGYTNAFLVNDTHDLALLYNDTSVLESHHAALGFQLTVRDEQTNIFQFVSKEEFRQLRQMVIEMVLATEMTKHSFNVDRFKSHIRLSPDSDEPPLAPSELLCDNCPADHESIVRIMIIKCADIANPVRPIELCEEWAKRITEEYCNQTAKEKEKKLQVMMPAFDWAKLSLAQSQESFMEFFIVAMFSAWDAFIGAPEIVDNMEFNLQYWKNKKEEAKKKKNRS